jgi:LysM repeat protein
MISRIVRLAFLILILAAAPAGGQEAPTYVVRPGDTLYRISRMYDIPVDELRRLNALEDNVIRVGQVLVISGRGAAPDAGTADHPLPTAAPGPSGREAAPALIQGGEALDSGITAASDTTVSGVNGRNVATYVIRPGDTLYGIAARFGTAAYLLYTLNDGVREPLEPYAELKVPGNAASSITYSVRGGDTLFRVARNFGVSVEDLRRANGIAGDQLRIGQRLRIPGDSNHTVAIPGEERLPAVYATGAVAVYPETFAGRLTAAGRAYDPAGFTVSHRTLPLGTIVLVENPATGRSTFAEVADRGPLDERHLMDVSAAVAAQLGLDLTRVQPVSIRIIE